VNDADVVVLHVPDYRAGNPYQRELATALKGLGISSVFDRSGRLFPLLGRFRRPDRPSLLHVHWPSAILLRASWLASLIVGVRTLVELSLLRRGGVCVVWTVHNLGDHERRHPRLEHFLTRAFARRCDAFITHCESARRALLATYGGAVRNAAVVRVIPHGPFTASYERGSDRAEARRKLSLEGGHRVFLHLGAVRRYKAIPALLRAFARIEARDVRLVIAGQPDSAETRAAIDALARRDPRVRLDWGFVPDDRVGDYLAAADAVVLPYTDILTSGAAVLAASFGVPVIAPQLGCIPETVGESGGILYEAGNPDALYEALSAAREADLEAMGAAALKAVHGSDWRRIGEETAELYRELVGTSDARGLAASEAAVTASAGPKVR